MRTKDNELVSDNMPRTEVKPTPDPTILTTEQLLRETANIEKLFNVQIDNMKVMLDSLTQSCNKHITGQSDINRVKSHLAKYYKKMGEEAPWQRD